MLSNATLVDVGIGSPKPKLVLCVAGGEDDIVIAGGGGCCSPAVLCPEDDMSCIKGGP
jgi:hypothetical protein